MSDLPAGWRVVPIERVLEPLVNGRTLQQGWSPQCLREPAGDGDWGVLKTTAIQLGHFEGTHSKRLPENLNPKPDLEVMSGDLLMTCAGPRSRCGVAALVRSTPSRLMLSGKMYRFRPDPSVCDPRYLELFLTSHEARLNLDKMKTGISESGLNLTRSKLMALELSIPPLEEQRRIVDVLEDHLSRLDAAAGYLDASSRRLDTVLEAVLSSMDLGSPVTLGSVLAQPLSNGRSVKTKDGGFPVLRLTALKSGAVDLFETKEGDWTASEAAPFLVRRGDLLVSRGNGSLRLVARGALVPEPLKAVAYPDTMIRVRAHPERVDGRYLNLVWNSRVVRRQIESVARTTAGIYKVNQRHLEAVEVPVPPPGQQRAVVARADSILSAGDLLASSLRAAGMRRAALRRVLLSAAFSGRLTGTSADTEVVEEIADSQGAP